MSCRCRPAGRLSALLSTGVCAQKPNLLALRAAERKLCRLPAEPQGKMLAPRNGGTRLCRQTGANSAGGRAAFSCFFGPGLTLGRCRLGAQIPAAPCSFVPLAPSLQAFSALGRHGLGAQTPAKPCSFVPFAPSLRTFSALGGKFPAGALKEEKENGRGHSPFPLSLNRKLPAERRKLTNCYSYAVYRSSRYLYRSSASFMYCDAPENIFDKLNR